MKQLFTLLFAAAIPLISLANKDYDIFDRLEKLDNVTIGTEFDFGGFEGHDLKINGIDCKVVEPEKAAKGNPWVLRARFWGHEPQTDYALLKAGFHITYCDVVDLYGSPAAVARWNAFYDVMRRVGLAKKVVLEGMSRGGLIIYNWAAANPSKVACIYADAPVMDIKSWPMGEGSSEGSRGDEQQMLKAYGFDSREQAIAWTSNPIDHAAVIYKARIPLIHVVGDVDIVVPVAENTAIFQERLTALRSTQLEVIHKPTIGHHPHSLPYPTPIVNFILKAIQ